MLGSCSFVLAAVNLRGYLDGWHLSSVRDFDIDLSAVPNIQITANTIKSSSLEALTTAIKQPHRDEKSAANSAVSVSGRPVISDRL
jgi:hypothetical protein